MTADKALAGDNYMPVEALPVGALAGGHTAELDIAESDTAGSDIAGWGIAGLGIAESESAGLDTVKHSGEEYMAAVDPAGGMDILESGADAAPTAQP